MANFRDCKGKNSNSGDNYDGDILEVFFKIPRAITIDGQVVIVPNKFTRKRYTARLNNPRKSQQTVLKEVCEEYMAENPLASFDGHHVIKGVSS
jgi:hypothetical protein